ncbi:MAG: YigZ family protein [Clostridia bacterium]|nr:YigZ family protein [Clostridia bacterium]
MGYTTVKQSSEFLMVERKSDFIGYCAPVTSEDEAIAFVNSIKKKHSDATHNVYAYVLREGFKERFSDDGEPHGTAGMPVLDSIRKAGLTDTAVVVTRYFGGILLGTGGLVRAYTAAASGAIKEAGIAEVGDFDIVEVRCNYSDYQKVMPLVSAISARTEDSDFGTEVKMILAVTQSLSDKFIADMIETTNGRVIASKIGSKTDFI